MNESSDPSKDKPAKKIGPWRLQINAAVRAFDELCVDYERAREGHRARLYEIAQKCYTVTKYFREHSDQYARFKEDKFWLGKRQKPKDDKVARAVLSYATKSRPELFESLITKLSKVLEEMLSKNVAPVEVATRLKEGGGIEKLYTVSLGKGHTAKLVDDLDLLNADPRLGDEEPESRTDHEDDAAAEDNRSGSKPHTLESGAEAANGSHRPSAVRARAADREPTITDLGGIATPPRPGGWKYDPDRDLIVDVSQLDLSLGQVLDMKKAAITFKVGLPDLNRWRPCVALRVEPATDEDDVELVDGEDNYGDAEEGWPTDDDNDEDEEDA